MFQIAEWCVIQTKLTCITAGKTASANTVSSGADIPSGLAFDECFSRCGIEDIISRINISVPFIGFKNTKMANTFRSRNNQQKAIDIDTPQ